MPQLWKLSGGGASAQQRADRLRTRSDKLARQATAWESGAEREPSVRKKLNELPPGYTVLHDLIIDDETRLDHLVIGNGGLYLVDAKKYSGRLVYSKKMLWHGRFPIVDKLEILVWEAERLSEILGQEVVPVMCFVDAVLPQPVTTLGSVIVCRVSVLHTIVRSTHATMSTTEVARILETAGQLAQRRGTNDVTNATPATWVASAEHDDDWPTLFESQPAGDGPPNQNDTGQTSAISTIPPIAGPERFDGPQREPKARRWPRRVAFLAAAVAGVSLAVVIVWNVSRNTEKTAQQLALHPPSTTAAPTTTSSTVVPSTTTTLDLSTATFSASCPNPGAGWQLRPVWPGELPGLAWYDFSFQNFDLSYTEFAIMTAPDITNYTPLLVPSANARTIRVRPVYTNGEVGAERITTWTAPAEVC
ncbi:MAG: hypothetical protein JWM34_1856 [Ilumatobacteraceae bacterium]|nr:hypothetical protein [Ilumatobacteraceae bacterium]